MTLLRAAAAAVVLLYGAPSFAQTAPDADAGAPVVAPPPPSPPAPAAPAPAPTPAAPGAPATPPPAGDEDLSMTFTAPRASDMSQFAEQSQQEVKIGGLKSRYSLNVFGDVGAGISGGGADRAGNHQDTSPTFGMGAFTMLFNGNLENSIKFTAELAVEPNDLNEIGIDLERLHLRYTHPSGFWIEAGRTHTNLGYWNLAYHHGRWLQPTIERPRGVRFEDDAGILPIHWIGAQIGYLANLSTTMSLTSSVALGNGRGKIVDNLQLKQDDNPAKQAYAQVELKGFLHRDLRAGISGVYGHISRQPATVRPALPDIGLDEFIGGVHVALPTVPWIAIAEGYLISHKGPDRSWETYDGFVVLGYALPPFTPYVKFERIVMTRGLDPFFVPDPLLAPVASLDVAEGIAGVRWDVSTWSAVKGEYRLERFVEIEQTTHVGYVSWQFGL